MDRSPDTFWESMRRRDAVRFALPGLGRLATFVLSGAVLCAAGTPERTWAQIPSVSANAVSPSTGPMLCDDPQARAFDFWIGEWDVQNRQRAPDDVRFFETGRATDRVYPVVGGCGIVEHWRGHTFGTYTLGFSVRAYDPATEQWTIVLLWPAPGRPSFGALQGGFRHGRGEFTFRRALADGDTAINRFTFSDIGSHSLRWENGTSVDGGANWTTGWIMEFTRRDPLRTTALLNGPAMTTRRCPAEEHRRFDPYLGEWDGVRTGADGDTMAVRVELTRILEGCAVMERLRATDRTWRAFRVRAYEPDAERWVEYVLDADRGGELVRRVADVDETLSFRDVSVSEGPWTRTRWITEEGTVGWVVEEAGGPEGPWRTRARVRLERALADGPEG